jgi:hypothetical protein
LMYDESSEARKSTALASPTFAVSTAAFRRDDQLLDAVCEDRKPELVGTAGLVSLQHDSRQFPIIDAADACPRVQL